MKNNEPTLDGSGLRFRVYSTDGIHRTHATLRAAAIDAMTENQACVVDEAWVGVDRETDADIPDVPLAGVAYVGDPRHYWVEERTDGLWTVVLASRIFDALS